MRMSMRSGGLVMALALGALATLTTPTPPAAQAQSPPTLTYSIGIQGLTCEKCAASAQRALAAVPGVVKASVDHKAGHAWVTVQALGQTGGAQQPRQFGKELAAAIQRAGAHHGSGFVPSVHYVLSVQGMTCEACAQHVTTALTKVPGVASVSVNYKDGYAVVIPSAQASPNPKNLVSAVAQAGYKAIVHSGP